MSKTCETCRWWDGDGISLCRRNPPLVVPQFWHDSEVEHDRGVWPSVDEENDWCGEHTPKEPTP